MSTSNISTSNISAKHSRSDVKGELVPRPSAVATAEEANPQALTTWADLFEIPELLLFLLLLSSLALLYLFYALGLQWLVDILAFVLMVFATIAICGVLSTLLERPGSVIKLGTTLSRVQLFATFGYLCWTRFVDPHVTRFYGTMLAFWLLELAKLGVSAVVSFQGIHFEWTVDKSVNLVVDVRLPAPTFEPEDKRIPTPSRTGKNKPSVFVATLDLSAASHPDRIWDTPRVFKPVKAPQILLYPSGIPRNDTPSPPAVAHPEILLLRQQSQRAKAEAKAVFSTFAEEIAAYRREQCRRAEEAKAEVQIQAALDAEDAEFFANADAILADLAEEIAAYKEKQVRKAAAEAEAEAAAIAAAAEVTYAERVRLGFKALKAFDYGKRPSKTIKPTDPTPVLTLSTSAGAGHFEQYWKGKAAEHPAVVPQGAQRATPRFSFQLAKADGKLACKDPVDTIYPRYGYMLRWRLVTKEIPKKDRALLGGAGYLWPNGASEVAPVDRLPANHLAFTILRGLRWTPTPEEKALQEEYRAREELFWVQEGLREAKKVAKRIPLPDDGENDWVEAGEGEGQAGAVGVEGWDEQELLDIAAEIFEESEDEQHVTGTPDDSTVPVVAPAPEPEPMNASGGFNASAFLNAEFKF